MSDQYRYANMTRNERDAAYLARACKLLSQDGTTMTQSQIDLFNAAETALREAARKVDELRLSCNGSHSKDEGGINHRAADQTFLKIDEAILWLREI